MENVAIKVSDGVCAELLLKENDIPENWEETEVSNKEDIKASYVSRNIPGLKLNIRNNQYEYTIPENSNCSITLVETNELMEITNNIAVNELFDTLKELEEGSDGAIEIVNGDRIYIKALDTSIEVTRYKIIDFLNKKSNCLIKFRL